MKTEVIDCDVLVVGGGINGAGIARDAAGRGLSVVLCEKEDLAAHTSSSSTKLIHGGLRYLEHSEFGLVRKALQEREVLMRSAPHLIQPLRFVMPHDKAQRPAWMIRAGLFLYDHLARRELLPGSGRIDLRNHRAGSALKEGFSSGFVYSDARVDDARLVILCAVDAAERGARILTRTHCRSAVRQNGYWHAQLEGRHGQAIVVRARCLVNAAGPWVAHFQHLVAPGPHERPIRLDKGSHIVVRKLFDHPYAYIFQHSDGRIVFAIPFERDFTLIGTTDVEYHGDPDQVRIDSQEIDYLCGVGNRYFRQTITPADVIWAYSGVRPLVEDAAANPSAVTRDYRLELNTDGAPILSVFGGKITTFRKLAEEVVDRLVPLRRPPRPAAWTANACLPGGDFAGVKASNRSVQDFEKYLAQARQSYAWLPLELVDRYFRAYGTRMHILLSGCRSIADLGPELLPGLLEAEARYWMQHEWAHTAADMLWRRSKLGLHLSPQCEAVLDEWIMSQTNPDSIAHGRP